MKATVSERSKELLISFLIEIGALSADLHQMIEGEDIAGLTSWCKGNKGHQALLPVQVFKDGLRIEFALTTLREMAEEKSQALLELERRLHSLTALLTRSNSEFMVH